VGVRTFSSGGGGGGSDEQSIDLTPASSVSYTITDYVLQGAGGIVDGWKVPEYAAGAPTVTESSGALDLSAAISPNHVRPSLDKQWANTGPAVMLPKTVIGDFDFQLKLKSDSGSAYLLAGIAAWMLNVNNTDYSGGIYCCRGYYSSSNSRDHAASIGNGTRRATTPSGYVAWTDSSWVRLKREEATITHSRRTGDTDAWTQIEEQTWDRAGGACYLGIALGINNGMTAEITVERIIATYTEYDG
tara:strand:- start:1089 stop:1823 length:735 start_codon:yes stop_codon:yes gene_type:complete